MGIMHRDVKPHNVMIDHEHRKVGGDSSRSGVSAGSRLFMLHRSPAAAAPYRLGFGRVLPPRTGVQREGGLPLLQRPRAPGGLSGDAGAFDFDCFSMCLSSFSFPLPFDSVQPHLAGVSIQQCEACQLELSNDLVI